MAKRVVIKRQPREVSGKLVKVNEECTLPNELARSLENKGLCVIVEHGAAVEMVETKMEMVPAKNTKAKAAKAKAAKVAKARAAGKAKAKGK
jgi:hypothetical protein